MCLHRSSIVDVHVCLQKQFVDSHDTIIFLTDGDPNDPIPQIHKVIADGNSLLVRTCLVYCSVERCLLDAGTQFTIVIVGSSLLLVHRLLLTYCSFMVHSQ